MKTLECTRLLCLLSSEYPHRDLTRVNFRIWQAILFDVPFPLGCEAVQDWIDGDPNRTRFPFPGQLRESALRLKPKSDCFCPKWDVIRGGPFWFRARLEPSADVVLWAAYGLTAPQIAVMGTSPSLVTGFDALRAAIALELRGLDSVRVPMSTDQVRAMLREAVAR